ncbi:hypothetical protein ABL78_5566 [Leptomonas seymouri]|uniref:Uncharacterized protein n=1 Tax=Leptomonas seymouri TaxID=5684 RepID=A0A0N1I4M9_LEPSE|nr:hypothetical protein ABL78_5566 [Leptomonas seymouri]|eukprot:KPI85385.1 hypothetical protein ABL78_5566 [Leptomonas seymouri]
MVMVLVRCAFAVAICVVVALSGVCATAAAAESRNCASLNSPPLYTFIGGGFHMQLAIEYPVAAQEATLSFLLPKSFFIDEAEAEQLYRMEIISSDTSHQGTSAVVVKDVTSAYTPLHMTSQFSFDIEAPVFKVSYSTNDVQLSFKLLPEATALDTYLGPISPGGAVDATAVKARLVIPIHSRYDTLDTTTPFSLSGFVLGEAAYVNRCLEKVELSGTSDARCGGTHFASSASKSSLSDAQLYHRCVALPVGLLKDLPYVYRTLMGLLVAGAVIVILAIR